MNILSFSENIQSLYSIADFSVRFTTLSEQNVSLQEEKSDVSSRRIGLKWFHFKILVMCQSICFSRRWLPYSFPCCWSHKLTFYLAVLKIVLKRSWRCNFPLNKRSRQGSWPCIFPPKNNPGSSTYAHLCKTIWNETPKPCAATRVVFGAISCSFSLCSSLMFRLFASALSRFLLCPTSLPRCLFSRSLSISLSLLFMFVDLFIDWLCVLSYTSSSIFFSQTQVAMQFPTKQKRPLAFVKMRIKIFWRPKVLYFLQENPRLEYQKKEQNMANDWQWI